MSSARKRVAVLISGRGSNMAALIEATADPRFPATIAVVVSNKADAGGLAVAKAAGIPTRVIAKADHPGAEAQDHAMQAVLTEHRVDLICLAGYMRLLRDEFVHRWSGRMINIHPSLLPLFKGLHPHEQALAAGVRLHGCSVHFVTSEMDSGPIIAQAAVPVLAGDTPDSLATRVLEIEHRLYPLALRLVAEGRARMAGDRVEFSQTSAAEQQALLSPLPDDPMEDLEALARSTP
ncbi:phosphoribosylglycinamide formyltransferase [Tianweitania sediminis]|uniref:Phosphoribosylglycinamide formyltransferase n=1 Tax=Tianweitania sediminis TaxID=1502156 RepID=A0A8J7R1M4_9HYPH|nr:phosphoribosylglycinamide formyltransferase [Tianweitania sediminis]MBP0439033.1 phosphoribosylglycinamide formyltransferase [Tianweitania sediminis]